MAVPTVEEIYDLVRALLTDEEIIGGEVFVNARLQPLFQTAFREMHDALALYGVPRQRKVVTSTYAANATNVPPATFGITDMSEPVKVESKPSLSAVDYDPVNPLKEVPQPTALSTLSEYYYTDSTFYFRPCTSGRDVRITYFATAPAAPATGSVGVDNSHNFLAFRTASLAAVAKGMDDLYKAYAVLALGTQFKPDGSAGFLSGLCSIASRSVNRLESGRPPNVRQARSV